MRWCTGTTRSPRRSRFECTMTAYASTIRALYPRVGHSRGCLARTRLGPTTRTSRTLSSGPAKSSRGDAGSTAFFVLAEGPGHRNRRSTWSLEASGSSLGFRLTTWRASAWRESAARVRTRPPRDQVWTKWAPSGHQVEILRKSLSARPITELMAVMGRKDRTKFRNQILRPMMDAGWIEMTIPDTPTSRKQRYRITEAGRAALATLIED